MDILFVQVVVYVKVYGVYRKDTFSKYDKCLINNRLRRRNYRRSTNVNNQFLSPRMCYWNYPSLTTKNCSIPIRRSMNAIEIISLNIKRFVTRWPTNYYSSRKQSIPRYGRTQSWDKHHPCPSRLHPFEVRMLCSISLSLAKSAASESKREANKDRRCR